MRYEQSDKLPEDIRPARLPDLVEGNVFWMCDPRRTPVRLCAVKTERADIIVEVLAFEDAGAKWCFPFWEIDKSLTKPGGPQASRVQIDLLQSRIARIQTPETCQIEPGATRRSHASIARRACAILNVPQTELPSAAGSGVAVWQDKSAVLSRLRAQIFTKAKIADIDQVFLRHWISNPNAGEFIKAHRIVLAELGLCPFEGHVLRD